jgi:SOS response regulatory protein OraA/RecX
VIGEKTGKRRRDDDGPMDADWLERKAIDYAARWETTERGVAQLLERKIRARCLRTDEECEPALALVAAVVEKLVARHYVDDQRAAQQLFERLERQGRSRAQIRARLLAKGVPESMAADLTRDSGPEADEKELRAAWQTARKRRLGPHCRDPGRRVADRNRHLGVLARQGFSSEVAYRVIDGERDLDETEDDGDGAGAAEQDRAGR